MDIADDVPDNLWTDPKSANLYIPSSETIGVNIHWALLKAFSASDGKYVFRSDLIDCTFTNQHRIPGSWLEAYKRSLAEDKSGDLYDRLPQLTQKERIILAIDVLRSTPSLFPNREMYHKYLLNHKKYALIVCDDLPQEYAEFLHDFYNC